MYKMGASVTLRSAGGYQYTQAVSGMQESGGDEYRCTQQANRLAFC